MNQTPTYAEAALEYQRMLIQDLDRILARAGLDKKLRQSICLSYAFQTGTLHDGARFTINDVELFPKIVFETEHGTEKLHPGKYCFHNSASNSVFEYFDSQEGL